jgi:hypothetical protein
MYVGCKKTLDTHVLHQVYDLIILHFSHCGTHYEPSLRSTIFVSVWSGIRGSFHSGSDFGTVSAAGAGSMTLDAAFSSQLCRWNTVVTAALLAV